jgi:TLC domain
MYGFYIFTGHDYLPKMLFGGCECHELTSNWPRWPTPQNVKVYYMIQLGHNIHSVLELFTGSGKRADVQEMALHHVATVTAIVFSYFGNQIPLGITVLMGHNIGDIVLNLGRFTRDLNLVSNTFQAILYALLVLSWAFPRIFLISACFLPAGYYYRFFVPINLDPVLEDLR